MHQLAAPFSSRICARMTRLDVCILLTNYTARLFRPRQQDAAAGFRKSGLVNEIEFPILQSRFRVSGNEKAPSGVGAFGIVVAELIDKQTLSIDDALCRKTAD
jgi:hypothetical protein